MQKCVIISLYLPSNGTIASAILPHLDLHFNLKNEMAISPKRRKLAQKKY